MHPVTLSKRQVRKVAQTANKKTTSKSGAKKAPSKSSKKTLISVTTRTGDSGTSGLANGQRLSKADLHFEVVGNLDELNSWLGLAIVKLKQVSLAETEFVSFLTEVQGTLFYVGAEVACSPKAKLSRSALTKLDQQTQALQEALAEDWHTRFVYPGGTELGAWLDIARTVCRRTERSLVVLAQQKATAQALPLEEALNPLLIKYINRLSDYIYVLRCFVNDALEYQEKEFVAK